MRSLAVYLISAAALAQPRVSDLLERRLMRGLEQIESTNGGVLGVALIDLASGHGIAHNGDTEFPQASLIKVPILVDVFRAVRAGELRLDERVTLAPADTVAGSGHLQHRLRRGPVEITIRDLVTGMIRDSDNTATNWIIRRLGMERINQTVSGLGSRSTRLRRIMLDTAASERGQENVATPLEMARLLELIYRGKAVDPQASREMLAILKLVEGDIRNTVPASIEVAAKTGGLAGVRTEGGIIMLPGRPFILTVMATYLPRGRNPIPEVAALAFEHFERVSRSNIYGVTLR